jgi:hypothetical protein
MPSYVEVWNFCVLGKQHATTSFLFVELLLAGYVHQSNHIPDINSQLSDTFWTHCKLGYRLIRGGFIWSLRWVGKRDWCDWLAWESMTLLVRCQWLISVENWFKLSSKLLVSSIWWFLIWFRKLEYLGCYNFYLRYHRSHISCLCWSDATSSTTMPSTCFPAQNSIAKSGILH